MWGVFGALVAGLVLGLIPGAGRWQSANKLLGTIGVLLLLGSMGVELGGNAAIMESLGQIGISAAVLAIGAVVGSIALVWPLVPVLRKMTVTKENGSEA